ncbi:TPA: response regulator [Candidatus Poribacteria bacterium]|nr:response regulator [Candidatus Poribacteria bacterium]HEX29529.1 response regulator [Candidatus Poribacteria bacterium]
MDKRKILIVEDDEDFASAVKSILEANSYLVRHATNREEACRMVEEDKPDLIILDIMMERLNDGFVLCSQFKNDPEYRDIPILAVSAITAKTGFKFSPQTDGEYFKADDYVEKPVMAVDLLKRVERLLEKEEGK